ncbi:hypothetical protein KIPB_014974, partial [Kipferlia bialata]
YAKYKEQIGLAVVEAAGGSTPDLRQIGRVGLLYLTRVDPEWGQTCLDKLAQRAQREVMAMFQENAIPEPGVLARSACHHPNCPLPPEPSSPSGAKTPHA